MNRPVLVWLMLSTIWGSTWLFVKIGVTQLPPLTFLWTRFVIALIPLLSLMVIQKRSWPSNSRDWMTVIMTGTLYFTFNYALIYWAETRVSSGLAAILYTFMPLGSMILAHFLVPGDYLNFKKLFGAGLGIFGVALIFWDQVRLDTPGAVWGAAAVLVATIVTSIGGIIVKRRAHHIDSVALTAGQMITGFVPICTIALIFEGSPFDYSWTSQTVFALFYLALLGTSATFVLLNWLVKHMEFTKTQLIPLASTLIAVLLGWAFLGERLEPRGALGMSLILGGLYFAAIFRRGAPKEALCVEKRSI